MEPKKHLYPAGVRERRCGIAVLLSAMLMVDSVIMTGFSLGFGLAVLLMIVSSGSYLLSCGKKPNLYAGLLIVLSAVIALGFARSDDYLMKFLMFLCLMVSLNLAICLMAGQNLRDPGRFGSVWDAFRAFFVFGFGGIGAAIAGLSHPREGEPHKRSDGLALGLVLAAVVLAVLIPVLISADAAFEGLMALLPKLNFEMDEIITTLLFGGFLGLIFYAQALGLHMEPKREPKVRKSAPMLNRLTVNIVLAAVCVVYLVYLVSQLAYFTQGFAGLLPKGFTPAEYARRGFSEMAWIVSINLGLIIFAAAPVRQMDSGKLTRGLSLFIGAFSLFLVASASSKMNLYIHQFGLTRLRVFTEVFMLWLAVTTAAVCLWLYLPKLPYMKVVIAAALVLCGAMTWADVDTQVAKYNVDAYFAGELSTVDVDYLGDLSSGAVPSLVRLLEAPEEKVAKEARKTLTEKAWNQYQLLKSDGYSKPLLPTTEYTSDLRGWNGTEWTATRILSQLVADGTLHGTPKELQVYDFD